MGGQRVLIDTGAIYAFVTRTDIHHESAKRFVREWFEVPGIFALADVVFAETMTLLKARLGPGVALRVGRELRRNPAYSWLNLGEEGERETWAAFQRYADKEWSYTDCALLALARRERIALVFAFDRHFSQMPGIERVP
ncbi:MAG TPA: PIN domain-containing protein [Thermoanaerobaculia bacterium]|nr:PIN domain-containing protein [Thermoanaerobaculia bacterium]